MGKQKSPKSAALARQSLPYSKLKKDPGVPKFVFKTKQSQKQAQGHKPRTQDGDMLVDSLGGQTIAGLAAGVGNGDEEESMSRFLKMAGAGSANDSTVAAHAYQFKKVLELADVVLEVLDARDPLGCRSRLVEEEVLRSGGNKKIILILNKTDLVPKENVVSWLKYLRHDFPTIPFKSSTQHQKTNLSSSFSKAASKGTPHLLSLLKSIRPAHSSITIGVVGPPNVGKSSLINSIKREKVCTVGAKPGETKALKEVVVERGIRVVDTPGIVWGDTESGSDLRNVWSLEGLDDPLSVVESIVTRVPSETLQTMYGIPPFRDGTELSMMVALSRGKLGKGGKPDLQSAALMILHDWNIGKIPYFTQPPAVHPSQIATTQDSKSSEVKIQVDSGATNASTSAADPYASTSIVTDWGKSFDLEGLWSTVDADVLAEDEETTEQDMMDAELPHDNDEAMGDDASLSQSEDVDGERGQSPPLPGDRKVIKPKQGKSTPEETHEQSLLANMNPLSRKRLRDEAKKNKKSKNRLERNNEVMTGDTEMAAGDS